MTFPIKKMSFSLTRWPTHGFSQPREVNDISELFRVHHAKVGRWAARMGGPGFDAQDAVQEVFMTAHRRLHDLTTEGKVLAWLFRTTRVVVRHQRRKRQWRLFLWGPLEETCEGVPSLQPTPHEELERRERVVGLYRILDELRDDHRTALILFELEGHSGDEIAELMGVGSSTVRVWLHRARADFLTRMREKRRSP